MYLTKVVRAIILDLFNTSVRELWSLRIATPSQLCKCNFHIAADSCSLTYQQLINIFLRILSIPAITLSTAFIGNPSFIFGSRNSSTPALEYDPSYGSSN